MLVRAADLSVHPAADEILRAAAGSVVSEVGMGELAWSNELVLHVVELKTNGPAPALEGLAALFQRDVRRINAILAPLGSSLLPTAMHPWMDPYGEARLWPHEYNAVYESFNRIFDCRGHGWSNLQSMHVNLPFSGDEEFGRLHAAVRLVLPILPAVAASSPIRDGAPTGLLDSRLDAYRLNCARVPSLTGEVIPEPVFTMEGYRREILERLYRDIAPYDPDGILQDEWLNARGAIARFDRNTIEIRVIDVQECPAADLAVAALAAGTARLLCEERWSAWDAQKRAGMVPLAALLRRVTAEGEATVIEDRDYLALLGYPGSRATAGGVWRHLAPAALDAAAPGGTEWSKTVQVLLDEGPLARRILRAVGGDLRHERLREVYRELADCLSEGRLFRA